MSWDFETDPAFQKKLGWADQCMSDEVERLDFVVDYAWNIHHPVSRKVVPRLQKIVRDEGLWAAHLGPPLGGTGLGQLNLALLNEVIGRSPHGPIVFGCQAPESGNAEILARYGTETQKQRYLEPRLAAESVSAFSMTEAAGGSDPTQFTTKAVRDGSEWVLTGEKWFTSHANYADFLIVLAVTDPDAAPHERMSTFVFPVNTPGVEIVRHVGTFGHSSLQGAHSYIRYNAVRLPSDALLGKRGRGFEVAQTRLGGGRIHHAMRTVAQVKRAFDMMCERALSRETKGGLLADKQLVQAMIAESWIQWQQFRLLVLRTAWRIDKYNDYSKVRSDIAAVKIMMPKVLHDVASRALQIHGSLGVSVEMPFGGMIMDSYVNGLADGATEVHQLNLARQLLKDYSGTDGLFPTGHLPARRQAALEKLADVLAEVEQEQALKEQPAHAPA